MFFVRFACASALAGVLAQTSIPALQATPAPTLRDRQPGADSTVRTARPAISASFVHPVGPRSLRVVLDGHDLTEALYSSADRFTVTPASDLAAGEHTVRVGGSLVSGGSFAESWDFTVRPDRSAARNFITVRSPVGGASVAPTFEFTGRTLPGSAVTIAASASSRGEGTGIIDPVFTAHVRANQGGDFSLSVTVHEKAPFKRVFVQSVSPDGSSAETTMTYPSKE